MAEALAARELVGPASGAADGAGSAVRLPPRHRARGRLRHADRRRSRARPPARGRVARAHAAQPTRRCWPSTSSAAASRPGLRWYARAAEQALEANDLGAAIERARRGVGVRRRRRRAGRAPAHRGRGQPLARRHRLAEERSVEATALLTKGSSSGTARSVRRASPRASSAPRRARRGPSPAAAADRAAADGGRADRLPGLLRDGLVFAGRTAAADAIVARLGGAWPVPRRSRRRSRPRSSSSAASARPTPAISPRASPASRPRSPPSSAPAIIATPAPSRQPQRRLRRARRLRRRRRGAPRGARRRRPHGPPGRGPERPPEPRPRAPHCRQLAEARRIESAPSRGFARSAIRRMEGVADVPRRDRLSSPAISSSPSEARPRRSRSRSLPPLRAAALAVLARVLIGRASRPRGARRAARGARNPRVPRRHRGGRVPGPPRPRRGPRGQRRSGAFVRHPTRASACWRAPQDQRRRVARALPRGVPDNARTLDARPVVTVARRCRSPWGAPRPTYGVWQNLLIDRPADTSCFTAASSDRLRRGAPGRVPRLGGAGELALRLGDVLGHLLVLGENFFISGSVSGTAAASAGDLVHALGHGLEVAHAGRIVLRSSAPSRGPATPGVDHLDQRVALGRSSSGRSRRAPPSRARSPEHSGSACLHRCDVVHRDAPFGSQLSHPPVALEGAADVVGRGVGDDELRPAVLRVEDGVLPEDPAERDRLFAVHVVHELRRLAPHALGLGLGADARLDPVAAEDRADRAARSAAARSPAAGRSIERGL